MADDASGYHIAAIRDLLLAAFTAETLRRFCLDRDLFRPVVAQFGAHKQLANMVDELIDYCRTGLLWKELLREIEVYSPRQYERFEARLLATGEVPPDYRSQGQRADPVRGPGDVIVGSVGAGASNVYIGKNITSGDPDAQTGSTDDESQPMNRILDAVLAALRKLLS